MGSFDVFEKVNGGGTILGDLFGYQDATLTAYLDTIFSDNGVMKFFYEQLYRDFAPDISGYTLAFFIPPHLSGYQNLISSTNIGLDVHYNQILKDSYMKTVGRIMTFAAIDFTPPQSQVNTESVLLRSGAIPIASEVSETDTCTVTYVDNRQLDIYMFHHIWVEYIREVIEGTIEPDPSYYTSPETEGIDYGIIPNSENYGAIDYAASLYIVKYRPDMKTVTFVGKCVGIFPQTLPNKEFIGSRTTNEIVILPFSYSCSGYREALYTEMSTGHWLFGELADIIAEFSPEDGSGMFSGFLGGVLNKAIGSPIGALQNLTGNAAKLGGIVGSTVSGVKDMWSKVRGSASDNGSQDITTAPTRQV